MLNGFFTIITFLKIATNPLERGVISFLYANKKSKTQISLLWPIPEAQQEGGKLQQRR